MEISRRLEAIANLVPPCNVAADIGTDHGYVPIELINAKKCQKAIAMDVNQGPLERARRNIAAHGLSDYIETRLSDGLLELSAGEADTVIIAGMGGALTIRILEQGQAVTEAVGYFILQPQSEIIKVRNFLNHRGMTVAAEDFIEEDGKYYPMMLVGHGMEEPYSADELKYGRRLLREAHPVLRRYLEHEIQTKEEILLRLKGKTGIRIQKRTEELQEELKEAKEALHVYF